MAETSTEEAPVSQDEATGETQIQTVETPQGTDGTKTDDLSELTVEQAEQVFEDAVKQRQERDAGGTETRDTAKETERPVDQPGNETEPPTPDKPPPFTDDEIATLKTLIAHGGSKVPQGVQRQFDKLNTKYGNMSETVKQLQGDISKRERTYIQKGDIEGVKESAPDVFEPIAAKIAEREEQESVERAAAEKEALRKSEQVSSEDIDNAVELKLLRRSYKDWEAQVGPNTPFQQWLTTQSDADDILNTKQGSVLEDALDRFYAEAKLEASNGSNHDKSKPKQTHRQRAQAAEVPESDRMATRQKADETLTDEQLFEQSFKAKRASRG